MQSGIVFKYSPEIVYLKSCDDSTIYISGMKTKGKTQDTIESRQPIQYACKPVAAEVRANL